MLFTAKGLGPVLKEDLAVVGDVGDVLADCLELYGCCNICVLSKWSGSALDFSTRSLS